MSDSKDASSALDMESQSIPIAPTIPRIHHNTSQPTQTTSNVNVYPAQAVPRPSLPAQSAEERYRREMASMQAQIAYLREELSSVKQREGLTQLNSVADTLPTPLSSVRYGTHTTRAATSRGRGLGAAFETPRHSAATAAAAGQMGEVEDEYEEAPAVLHPSISSMLELSKVMQIVKGLVDPFYGDSVKDKDSTVADFVEKLESTMSDTVVDRPHMKLSIVRLLLKDNAMRWMNQRMIKLNTEAETTHRNLVSDPITWDRDVRTAFINAHMGIHTQDMWMSQLGALRLGQEKTMTPMEFDSKFDAIARHVFPRFTAGDVTQQMVLCRAYRDALSNSSIDNPRVKRCVDYVVRMSLPSDLDQWKTALANQWQAEDTLIRMNAAQQRAPVATATTPTPQSVKGRGRGATAWTGARPVARGKPFVAGQMWRNGSWHPVSAAVMAAIQAEMEAQPGAGTDGADNSTGEGQQLTATASSPGQSRGGMRGGRGRGGGGRGQGSNGASDAERQGRYERGECFLCGQLGHNQYKCPTRETAQLKQLSSSNEQADQ